MSQTTHVFAVPPETLQNGLEVPNAVRHWTLVTHCTQSPSLQYGLAVPNARVQEESSLHPRPSSGNDFSSRTSSACGPADSGSGASPVVRC